jgi:hypothetical protein
MHFCSICSRAMKRVCASGTVVYRCACGQEEKGDPADARIGGGSVGSSNAEDTFRLLIRNAPFDRTNKVVKRDCKDCGLDYMTQLRLGEAEMVIYRCKCGRQEDAGGAAAETKGRLPPGAGAGRGAAEKDGAGRGAAEKDGPAPGPGLLPGGASAGVPGGAPLAAVPETRAAAGPRPEA